MLPTPAPHNLWHFLRRGQMAPNRRLVLDLLRSKHQPSEVLWPPPRTDAVHGRDVERHFGSYPVKSHLVVSIPLRLTDFSTHIAGCHAPNGGVRSRPFGASTDCATVALVGVDPALSQAARHVIISICAGMRGPDYGHLHRVAGHLAACSRSMCLCCVGHHPNGVDGLQKPSRRSSKGGALDQVGCGATVRGIP